ncbi:MAG: ribose-phosphate diphosphokinase [Spirochaetales bacterium]|nr:ribose-phosphate diphosphokinase [Spirochaetales bacterium]MCF7937767.1 ribose-phosphate diphosphokinase [Spirochaetales bacterium]
MSFSKPASLGILACPGAEQFTEEMLAYLKNYYMKTYRKKADILSERYGTSQEEIIRQMNLADDLRMKRHHNGPVEEIRLPAFRIPARYTCFANGEFKTEILSSVRGMDVFIVQDVENHYPQEFYNSDTKYSLSVNDNIFLLFVTIDAVQQAGANSITLVLPTYPYSRQHRKKGREGLTASRFGQIVEYLGVSRLITLDIHSKEIENSFNRLRLENLHASYQVLRKLSALIDVKNEELVVVSPDTGAIDRNKYYAGSLKKPLALIYKERDYSKVSNSATDSNITQMRLLGDVEGKTVFMADDLLGTGGTLLKAMQYLTEERGAKRIIASISLPFFTGDAREKFEEAYQQGFFYRIIGTNAIYHDEDLLDREWYVSANISNLFAKVIARLHHDASLSALLDNSKIIQKMLKKGDD